MSFGVTRWNWIFRKEMIPKTDHLFWLRHDVERFEAERNRIISEYIRALPEEKRAAAYAMQLKIDEARLRLSDEDLLKWMVAEAAELQANLVDQFNYVAHKAEELKKLVDGA